MGNYYLHRLIDEEKPEEEICYDVDLIWDGTNYHIAYSDGNGGRYIQPFTYTDARVWCIKVPEQSSDEGSSEGETQE